jgi:CheY-like chemotaxis protein
MTRRILVVDDELNWRRILGQIIEDMRYEVRTATCLSEAKQLLKSLQFDLALVDMYLDEAGLAGEGGRLFYLLCEQYPHIPVIAITAKEIKAEQMRDLFVGYRIRDWINKTSLDVRRFGKLIRVVIVDDTQVAQGFGAPPTSEAKREILDASSAICQLAALIRVRHEVGNRPYTLLLGSSLSLTPELRQAVCGSDAWGIFWTEIEGLSADERYSLLIGPLSGLNLTAGYRCLTELAQAGYFNIILTANIDDALDNALRTLEAGECQVLCHGRTSAQEIAVALSRPVPRVNVVKLRGDINAYKSPLTSKGQFEFPEALEEAVGRLLSQDTILVGDIPYDTDIQRCIREGEGALWIVAPEAPRLGSFLYNAIQSRPGKVISGSEADFVPFFSTLARELGVEGPRTSMPSPREGNLIEFTFMPPEPDDYRNWFSAFRRITEEGRANGDWTDNNGDKHRFRHLEHFVEPFYKGQVYDASFSLYSKDADGNFYEEVVVIVKVKPERELSFEVTDRTQTQKQEELANRILQRIGSLRGVQLISLETL